MDTYFCSADFQSVFICNMHRPGGDVNNMEVESRRRSNEFAIVRAEESGVTVYAVPFENGEPHQPPVRLDAGELYIMLISDSVRGYKIRGKVELLSRFGTIKGESKLIVQSGSVDNC